MTHDGTSLQRLASEDGEGGEDGQCLSSWDGDAQNAAGGGVSRQTSYRGGSWGDLRGNRRVGLPGGRVARMVLILHTDASSASVGPGAPAGLCRDPF